MEIRPIDANALQELCNRGIQNMWNTGVAPVSWAAAYADFKNDIDSIPTLTPQNEPLPVLVNDEQGREYIDYICPRCKGIISQRRRGQRMETVYQCKFHDNCGQRVDWENQQSYRRPPEGEV